MQFQKLPQNPPPDFAVRFELLDTADEARSDSQGVGAPHQITEPRSVQIKSLHPSFFVRPPVETQLWMLNKDARCG